MRVRTTPSAVTPASVITADEFRLYARAVDVTAEDSLIEAQIKASVKWVEQYIGRSINTNTFTLQVWNFDNDLDLTGNELWIHLPSGPVTSITSVKSYDEDGTETTLTSGTDFYLLKGDRLRILSATGIDSFEIVYVAAMSALELNDNIKQAIYKLTTELYMMKGLSVTGMTVAKLKSDLTTLLAAERAKLNW
jgi:uncharacterized phiE125 gp8 family phage protein